MSMLDAGSFGAIGTSCMRLGIANFNLERCYHRRDDIEMIVEFIIYIIYSGLATL